MPLILEHVPCVIIEYKGRKKNGHAATQKFLELELNLNDHIEALDGMFPGLEQRLGFIASAEGGPEDATCRSAIGDVSVKIVAAADKKTEVLHIDLAKAIGKLKLHIGPKSETLRARFKCVGSLAAGCLPKVDDFTGADVLVNIATLQADIADKPAKAGGKGGARGSRKTQIDLADGGKADVGEAAE